LSFDIGFHQPPMLLSGMQTTQGFDTASVRCTNLTAAGTDIWVEEERSLDSETGHIREAIGWAAFE
jgi:hypothetical protein